MPTEMQNDTYTLAWVHAVWHHIWYCMWYHICHHIWYDICDGYIKMELPFYQIKLEALYEQRCKDVRVGSPG